MKIPAALALLTLGLAPWAAADVTLEEARDHQVHVWAPDRVTGRLVGFDDKTVTLRLPDGARKVFDRTAIDKMEMKRGRGFHVGLTLAGAGAGALTALGFAVGSCEVAVSSPSNLCDSDGTDFALVALGSAALGALVTHLATRNIGWRDVAEFEKAKVSTAIVPQRRGLGVLVAVRF